MSALDVAAEILHLAAREGVPVSPMKLNKLAYICHGWHLAIVGRPLFDETVEAWAYGPVVPSLYHEYKHFGRDPISESGDVSELPANSRRIIRGVWEKYNELSATQLSAMTHSPGTPWSETKRIRRVTGGRIDNEMIRRHFRDIATGARDA